MPRSGRLRNQEGPRLCDFSREASVLKALCSSLACSPFFSLYWRATDDNAASLFQGYSEAHGLHTYA